MFPLLLASIITPRRVQFTPAQQLSVRQVVEPAELAAAGVLIGCIENKLTTIRDYFTIGGHRLVAAEVLHISPCVAPLSTPPT